MCLVGVLDASMTALASACTGGTGEDKKVLQEPCPAAVLMPAHSCSCPNPIFTWLHQPVQKDEVSSKGSPVKPQT